MNMDDVTARYAAEVGAAEGRQKQHVEKAHEQHTTAEAEAHRAHERALRVASATLGEALRTHAAAHEEIMARALDKFDTSARNILGVPDGIAVTPVGTTGMQLKASDGYTVLASATYLGPSGWAVDAPDGRTFLGPEARIQARAMLWQIAAGVAIAA